MKVPEWFSEPRTWQTECGERIMRHWEGGGREFLVEAYPGSGKTALALWMTVRWVTRNKGGKVVIVAPSDNLRIQWMNEAASFGINLDNEYNGTYALANDMHGVVQTYATISNNPLPFQRLVMYGGIAVLDEVHHAGDQKSWGDGLQQAFGTIEHAAFKVLSLSGTPFRSDNARIPFVRYVNAGNGVMRSQPDYRYGYGEALGDGVVRSVIFPEYEGETTWMDDTGMRSVSFDDKLRRDDESKRLITAITPSTENEYVCEMIRHANDQLMEIRGTHHRDAAGLVVAVDVRHAYAIASLMQEVIGIRPQVVASKDDGGESDNEASERVAAFRKSRDPWIIAVNMISEGVDIKRLRIGVYLSNKKTPLFLTQVIGRVIRVIQGIKKQEAYFFFPKDAAFVEVISNLQQERDHLIVEDVQDDDEGGSDLGMSSDGGDREPVVFVPVSGIYTGHIHEYGGQQYTQDEVEYAANLASSFGLDVDPVKFAAALRKERGSAPVTAAAVRVSPDVPVKIAKTPIRREVSRLIRYVCQLMQASPDGMRELGLAHRGFGATGDPSFAFSAAWVYAKNMTGINKKPAEMSMDELHAVLLWVKQEVLKWK